MDSEKKNKKKQIAILGSTGSIGTQALQVIEEHPDLYEAYALTANNRVELLIAQARKFQPEVVVIANEEKYAQLKEALSDLPIKVYAGIDAVCQIVEAGPVDMVLTAMVGYAGLKPTINAIRAKKAIALANKETLVVAGELINQLAQQYHTPILPVDSEHSAVFQCLAGEVGNPIEKVILTASGGPFRTCTLEQLKSVTKTQALAAVGCIIRAAGFECQSFYNLPVYCSISRPHFGTFVICYGFCLFHRVYLRQAFTCT